MGNLGAGFAELPETSKAVTTVHRSADADMRSCRNEYFLLVHMYAPHGILARGLLTFINAYRAAFPVVLIGNQADSE